jgi:carbamoylphosphate synthase large subunit
MGRHVSRTFKGFHLTDEAFIMKRILVTGAGGAPGNNFIRSLRAAPEKMVIIGVDCNKYHLEWPDADRCYLVPLCKEPDYIDRLNEIIQKEKIDFVHPQPDVEVLCLAENRHRLSALSLLPRLETIRICQDKYLSVKMWLEKGIPAPKSMPIKNLEDLSLIAEELGFPFWLRATQGAGGRGSTPVDNLDTARYWIQYWRSRGIDWEFVAHEYLPGKNIAFQSLWKDGELVTSQARERLEYLYPFLAPSGVTGTPVVARTVHRQDINEIAYQCVKAIDPKATGIFSVDLKEDKNGIPMPTEINPGRFFTTSYFFTAAGSNIPYWYVCLGLNEKIPSLPQFNSVEKDLYWIRHMDCPAVLVKEGQFRCLSLKND